MTKEGIKKILKVLEESLEKLRPLARMPRDEFLKSTVSQDIAKWNFYVAVQGCLDLGNHVISIKGFDIPEGYEDIIMILEKNEIIPKKIAASLRGMGGFRNLIAHGYFKLDLFRLYSYLKQSGQLKEFLKKLEPYL